MLWPGRRAHHSQAKLIAAVEASNAVAAQAALDVGAEPNAKNADGDCFLRESLPLMSALLAAGARPDGPCAESVALWAERADRARRHKCPDADRQLIRAHLAVALLNQHRAPWDARPPTLGGRVSVRMAIRSVLPAALPPEPEENPCPAP